MQEFDDVDKYFEIDCEACDTLCEILIDVYVTDEHPSYCPFCGSPVSTAEEDK